METQLDPLISVNTEWAKTLSRLRVQFPPAGLDLSYKEYISTFWHIRGGITGQTQENVFNVSERGWTESDC